MRGPSLDRSRVWLALLAVGAWMFARSRGDARPAFPEPNESRDVSARANVAAPVESNESDATSVDPQSALVADSEAAIGTKARVRPARIRTAPKRGPKWNLVGTIVAQRPGFGCWGVDLELRSVPDGAVVVNDTVLVEDRTASTTSFRISELDQEAYTLSASTVEGFSVLPSAFTVRRLDPSLQLTLENDEPGYDLRITLHDVGGRRIISDASASVWFGEGSTGCVMRDGVLDMEWRMSLRARYELLLGADGFMPLRMTSEELLGHLNMSAAEAPFDLELEPGWGVELRFECAQGPESCRLDGIDVKCDGEFAGTTDANGVLLLRRMRRPTRMQLDSSLVRSAIGGDEIEVPEPGTLRWAWSVQSR